MSNKLSKNQIGLKFRFKILLTWLVWSWQPYLHLLRFVCSGWKTWWVL